MARERGFDVRQEVMRLLLEKIEADRHPSGAMLNTVEQLLTPQYVQPYAQVLMKKLREDKHPSNDMLKRLLALA
jgi:hypothetical protein